MLQRLTISGALLIAAAITLCACGGGGDQAPIPNPGAESAILLPSGGGAVFPAGSFDNATEVDVNEELSGDQRDASTFPANSGGLIGSTTVKVPAGVALNRDIEVRIAVSPPQATNMVFTIFEYNNATRMWETTAGASSTSKAFAAAGAVTGGSLVAFEADTAGTTGLDVTYGVFENFGTATGGGGGTTPEPNEIPTVSLSADDNSVDAGDSVTLTATGSDPDGDALTFSWSAAAGTLGTADTAGGTSTNTWSADAGGAYTVSVSVNDGNGGVATDAVNIAVAGEGTPPPVNDPPEFEGDITGDVAAPVVGQKIWLTAVAHDPEHGELTFDWSGPGTFADPTVGEHGAQVFWTPDAEGSQTATCTASDPEGNETTADYTATVAAYPTAFDFVGYATCLACHSDKGEKSSSALGGTGWFNTNHSDAIQRNLSDPGNAHAYRNPSCYNCHALGWEPNDQGQGFIDIDLTPEYANIQCESCHGGGATAGMGAGHKGVIWNPLVGMVYDDAEETWVPDSDFDASNGIGCGACHEGARHGAVEEWAESGHANFVLTEEDDENPGTFVPDHYLTIGSCNPCHSGVQFATIHKGEDPLDLSGLTIDDPLEDHLIGCATCHDPHDAQYEAQLRVDSEADVVIPFDEVPVNGGKGNICIECHNGRRTRANYDDHIAEGSGHFGPHGNPQGAMFFGVMGADLGNPPVTGSYVYEHPHLTWNDDTCVTCHMYNRPYISADEPALWGHDFEPKFERCITCHTNWTMEEEEDFWLWVEEYQAEIDVMLQEFLDAWPAVWMDEGEPVSVESNPGDGDGPPASDPVGNAYRAALWDYYLVLEDQTRGVHNPTFTMDVLEQAIAAVEALPPPPAT